MIGVVLAGGRSSRMGRPKAFVEIEGRPLVERALDALSQVCDRLLVVAASEGSFAHLGLPVAVDGYPGSGPLAGIHAALGAAGGEASGESCLVAACDQPFLSPALLAVLVAKAGEGGAARAAACRLGSCEALYRGDRRFGRFLPFPAVYPASAQGLAAERLERGELRLMPFLEALDPLAIDEEACRACDPELLSFANLNRPEELEAARSIAARSIAGSDPRAPSPRPLYSKAFSMA